MDRTFVFALTFGLNVLSPGAGFCEEAPADTLETHLKAIARPRSIGDPARLKQVEDYVGAALASYGYAVERQEFTWNGATYANVVALKKGQEESNPEVVLVTAHFDAVAGSPGADDNASGVAVLLELARMAAPYRFGKTLKFAALNFEEADGQGAQLYIRQAQQNRERIAAVVNLEMVGYRSKEKGSQRMPANLQSQKTMLSRYAIQLGFPDIAQETDRFLSRPAEETPGDFLAAVANEASMTLLESFLRGARRTIPETKLLPLLSPQNGAMLPDTRRSDHAAFWDAGYPALLLTDTADLRNPNYHQASDAVDTLDLEFMRENVKAIFSGLMGVLGASTP